MKQTLKWHKDCLVNVTAHVERLRKDVERRVAELAADEQRLADYVAQIERAEKEGLDGFDRDKFNVKRKSLMLDRYANPEVTGIKLLMPAGEYYLGDPCYVLDSEWETVCAALEGKDIGGPILRSNEGVAIAFSTAYGDGCYEVKKGYHTIAEVPVDAGLIGLVPVALAKTAPKDGLMIRLEFPRDFECQSDGKVLKFGRYEVATDD